MQLVVIIVYTMKQDTKWGMGQALSCDLSARAESHFSYFLTFRVLGQKPKKSSLASLSHQYQLPVPQGKPWDFGPGETCLAQPH